MGYLSFDVDGIQNYVFASYRPVDIHGASELVKSIGEDGEILEKFINEMRKEGADKIEVIYAIGGSGVIRIPDEFGEEAVEMLESLYKEHTLGNVTAAFVPGSSLNRSVFRKLHTKIRQRKSSKLLDVKPTVTSGNPQDLCDACGVRTHQKEDAKTGEKLCVTCFRKRETGKKVREKEREKFYRAVSLEDLLLNEEVNKRIGLIYADLRKMGAKLEEWAENEEKLRKNSNDIWQKINELVENIVSDFGLDGHIIDPVIGGDDLILILPEEKVLPVVERILDANEGFKEYDTSFSIAFVTAYYKFPIYLLFEYSKTLLQKAKIHADKREVDSAVNFHRITSGWVMPPKSSGLQDQFYIQPTARPYTDKQFRNLLEEAKEIRRTGLSTSLLYTLYNITTDSDNEEEMELNLSYYLVRHKSELPESWRNFSSVSQVKELFTPDEKNRLADLIEILKLLKIGEEMS